MINILNFSYYKEYEQNIQEELSILRTEVQDKINSYKSGDNRGRPNPILEYKFINANLDDDTILKKQREESDINLIIFSLKNIDNGLSMYGNTLLLKSAIQGLQRPEKTIIYLKTVEGSNKMSLHNFRLCFSVINEITKNGGIAILNDLRCLCEGITSLTLDDSKVLKVIDYVRVNNILKYEKYLLENYPEYFVESKCLLAQSVYIINKVNERSTIKG